MRFNPVRSVLDSALRRASQTGAQSIRGCEIAIGELVEVTPEAFLWEWKNLARGTLAESAVLHFHRLPAELQCMVCFEKYHPADPAPACPRCGSVGAKVLSGEECYLESIRTGNSITGTRA